MYIERTAEEYVRRLSRQFPVVVVTGPRQSGKTTLVRHLFPDASYVSLEAPDTRAFVRDDARSFLAGCGERVVVDEVQRVPEFLSYLQGEVDERPVPGRFILTGSANLLLMQSVTQSLAGRAAFATLLPLSLEEVEAAGLASGDLWTTLWTGSYPVLHDRRPDPAEWLANYLTAYVERDVRTVLNVTDLTAFLTFMGLCAGRSGGVLNLAGLASDCGITQPTAKAWLSVLEACYLAFRVPIHHLNVNRRLVKAPKLYFHDTGLLCRLLGVRSPAQLATHPLRGAVFETFVASEVAKARLNRGARNGLSYFRDHKGHEVDLVVEGADALRVIEIKSGATVASDWFADLELFGRLAAEDGRQRTVESFVVYGGEGGQRRTAATVVPWRELHGVGWT